MTFVELSPVGEKSMGKLLQMVSERRREFAFEMEKDAIVIQKF